MKFILAVFLLITSSAYTQQQGSLIHEIHIFPASESYNLYYSFRIPYNRVVFEKDNDLFIATYEVMIELNDSSGAVIARHFESKQISVTSFEETNSEELYSEGLIQFKKVPAGKHSLQTVVSDKKNGKELRLPSEEINISTESKFFSPVVVYASKVNCDNTAMHRLANFDGNIPFSETSFDIIIPSLGTDPNEIEIEFVKEDSVYWKGNIKEKINGSIRLKECDGILLGIEEENSGASNFIVNGVSGQLPEGQYTVQVYEPGEHNKKESFNISIRWYNRPYSLSDPEYALKVLKYIISEDEISLLMDKSSDLREVLDSYWEDLDPTPETMFNPLMREFYARIDYAARNYSSLLKKDGANSDRGRIFIKFGKPSKIERSYNLEGDTIETWVYDKNKFIFVDKKGTGEFLLLNG